MLTLAGPDASKVGCDFNVTISIVSEPESGLSAHCPPQVRWPPTKPFWVAVPGRPQCLVAPSYSQGPTYSATFQLPGRPQVVSRVPVPGHPPHSQSTTFPFFAWAVWGGEWHHFGLYWSSIGPRAPAETTPCTRRKNATLSGPVMGVVPLEVHFTRNLSG